MWSTPLAAFLQDFEAFNRKNLQIIYNLGNQGMKKQNIKMCLDNSFMIPIWGESDTVKLYILPK
jgi:hypothetical protein